eukprot:gene15314-10951_t
MIYCQAIVAVAIVFLSVLVHLGQAQLLNSPWPVAGQNVQQTRQSPYAGPRVVDPYWTFLAWGQLSSEPVVGTDGTLYFATSRGVLYSLSPYGIPNWNLTLNNDTTASNQALNSPVVGSDGSIYVADEDKYVYRVSSSGTMIWRKLLDGGMIASPVISNSADILYVSTSYSFFALYADTGNIFWNLPYSTSYTPAIGPDDTIYFCSSNVLYAVAKTGFVKWRYTVSSNAGTVGTSPMVGPDGTVYLASNLFIFAISEAELQWQVAISAGSILNNMILDTEGNIYLANGASLYCISVTAGVGSLKWNWQTGSSNTGFETPMIDSQGIVYLGSQSGYLYAVDTAVTYSLWKTFVDKWIVTSPILLQSGVLVVADITSTLYAYRPANCSAGTYVTPGGASFCTECDLGYYSDEADAASCTRCPYPWTSIHTGQTKCTGILMLPEGSVTTLALILTAMAVVVLVCMYHGQQRVAIFINLVFPTLDVFSDLAYLTTNEFYNLALFVVCFVSIAIPTISFMKSLWERGARPSLYVKLRDSWWLRAGNDQDHVYYPLFPFFAANGHRLPLLSSTEHSSFASVLMEGLAWVCAIVAQVATFVVVIPANVLFLGFWFVVGAFLHLSKMITIGSVWNVWFQIWTQSDLHATDVDVDTAELIVCLEEEFLTETIPQFIIQLTNNLLLGRFTPIAAFSMTFSVVMSINSVWRHVYHRFVRTETVALEEIPLGMVWRIQVEAWELDWVLVDATLRSARKKRPKEYLSKAAAAGGSTAATAPLLAEAAVEDWPAGDARSV